MTVFEEARALQTPTSRTLNYPLSVAAVRHVVLEPGTPHATVLVYAADVVQVLDSGPEAVAVVDEAEVGHLTVHEGHFQLAEPLLLTIAGIRQLANYHGDPERSRFVDWVETELTVRRVGHRAPNPSRTKWGWQPIRDLVRLRGYTARRFTEEANALDLPVERFNQGNYIAWAYGGCLPAESLVVRACELLEVEASQLFNANVLAAYPNRGKGRRRPVTTGE